MSLQKSLNEFLTQKRDNKKSYMKEYSYLSPDFPMFDSPRHLIDEDLVSFISEINKNNLTCLVEICDANLTKDKQ